MVNRWVLPLQSNQAPMPTAPHSSPASSETLKDGCSRPMAIHILICNKSCSGLKFKAGNMYQQVKVLMSTFSFLSSFLSSLSSPTCLLIPSSFKGFTLSAIPNAHMEANKYVLFVPSYESSNVKVTWQIFSIPNVRTIMDFPEGTVFQKLCEIRLAGQEGRNAATTRIP